MMISRSQDMGGTNKMHEKRAMVTLREIPIKSK